MTFGPESVIGFAGLVLAIIALGWQIIEYLSERKPGGNLEIDCKPSQIGEIRYLTINASIENIGKRNLYLHRARLLIDEGSIQANSKVDFPFLWHWEKGCKDCQLGVWCKTAEALQYPIYPFSGNPPKDELHFCSELGFLSTGMQWVFPGETSAETRVLVLPKSGFYRVTMVVVPKNFDCFCKSKVIYVP